MQHTAGEKKRGCHNESLMLFFRRGAPEPFCGRCLSYNSPQMSQILCSSTFFGQMLPLNPWKDQCRHNTIFKAKPHLIKRNGERATAIQPLSPLWWKQELIKSHFCQERLSPLWWKQEELVNSHFCQERLITRKPCPLGRFLSSRTADVQMFDRR